MTGKREFLSTNEVAQTLGISPFTIRRYIKLRMLKAVKLEGSYRVRQADLEQFLKAREVETETELAAQTPIAPPAPRREKTSALKRAPRKKHAAKRQSPSAAV